jgi:hypothetical protein
MVRLGEEPRAGNGNTSLPGSHASGPDGKGRGLGEGVSPRWSSNGGAQQAGTRSSVWRVVGQRDIGQNTYIHGVAARSDGQFCVWVSLHVMEMGFVGSVVCDDGKVGSS